LITQRPLPDNDTFYIHRIYHNISARIFNNLNALALISSRSESKDTFHLRNEAYIVRPSRWIVAISLEADGIDEETGKRYRNLSRVSIFVTLRERVARGTTLAGLEGWRGP